MVSGNCLVLLALGTRDEYLSAFYMAVLLLPVSHFLASYWSTILLQMYCCIKCIILYCIKCGNNNQLTTLSQYFREEWRADSRSNIKTQACVSGCESQSLHSSQALQFSRKSAIILSSLLPVCYCRCFYSGCYESSPFPGIMWAISEPGDSWSCEMSRNIWVCRKRVAFECKPRVMADWKESYCMCGRSLLPLLV